ncbi:hypothetical protein [uncultured Brevibacillus sp.]|uniref:hypothetical protein n=1 Tax=uncultured Brevibacillus sp. TaxID=169970 RepID=UPI00259503CA|nr:hypothetical protein [uncultured Brevibacillus sp.]
MARSLPSIKRGDTFCYYIKWEGAVLSELKSQIRDGFDRLLADVTIEETGDLHTFKMSVPNTEKWPIGTLLTDIQRVVGGIIQSSETMSISVIKDVTRDE